MSPLEELTYIFPARTNLYNYLRVTIFAKTEKSPRRWSRRLLFREQRIARTICARRNSGNVYPENKFAQEENWCLSVSIFAEKRIVEEIQIFRVMSMFCRFPPSPSLPNGVVTRVFANGNGFKCVRNVLTKSLLDAEYASFQLIGPHCTNWGDLEMSHANHSFL